MCLTLDCSTKYNSGRNVTFRGQIFELDGETTIPFANIYVSNNSRIGTTSDFSGEFELTVPINTPITISYMGYKTQTFLASDDWMLVFLEPSVDALDPVVITTTRKKPFPWWMLLIPVGLYAFSSSSKTVNAKI